MRTDAVGTVDQAMAAVLTIRYGMLRLAGLTNKVLIVDEMKVNRGKSLEVEDKCDAENVRR